MYEPVEMEHAREDGTSRCRLKTTPDQALFTRQLLVEADQWMFSWSGPFIFIRDSFIFIRDSFGKEAKYQIVGKNDYDSFYAELVYVTEWMRP